MKNTNQPLDAEDAKQFAEVQKVAPDLAEIFEAANSEKGPRIRALQKQMMSVMRVSLKNYEIYTENKELVDNAMGWFMKLGKAAEDLNDPAKTKNWSKTELRVRTKAMNRIDALEKESWPVQEKVFVIIAELGSSPIYGKKVIRDDLTVLLNLRKQPAKFDKKLALSIASVKEANQQQAELRKMLKTLRKTFEKQTKIFDSAFKETGSPLPVFASLFGSDSFWCSLR